MSNCALPQHTDNTLSLSVGIIVVSSQYKGRLWWWMLLSFLYSAAVLGGINVNPRGAIVSQHTHQHTKEKRIPMTPRSSSVFVCKDCGKSVFFKAVIYRTSIQMCEHSVSRLYFIPECGAGSYISVAGTRTSSICTPDKAGVYAATVNLKNLLPVMLLHGNWLSPVALFVFTKLQDGGSFLPTVTCCESFNKGIKILMVQTAEPFVRNLCDIRENNRRSLSSVQSYSAACGTCSSAPRSRILMALVWWCNFVKISALCKWSGTCWHLTAFSVCSALTACWVFPD